MSKASAIGASSAASRWTATALGAMLTMCGPLSAAAPNPTGTDSDGEYARGRLLAMPRAGVSDAQFDKTIGAQGAKARRIGQSRLYIVDLPAGASERAVAERLAHDPHLKFAELDRKVKSTFAANDPYVGSEWHIGKIGASSAWDTAQGSGVTIAIIDSGVESSHPDLSAQMIPGWNFVDNNSNTADVYGHGTAVAGAAAATMNNGAGVAGVAGQSKVLPVRVSDSSGVAYWSTIAQGITYAADKGARVANASFAGIAGSSAVQSAAQYMKNKNGLVFISAGNNGIDEGVGPTTSFIVVSATDSNDMLTTWSSYGNFVSLSAPGQTIYTTDSGGGYGGWWGTSFASPLSAGTAALVMSANPALSSTQVESILFSSAVDLGAAGRDSRYGYGRVDAAAAVQAAVSGPTSVPIDTQAPSASITAPLAQSSVSGLVPVNVSASDNVGVRKVELRVNGSAVATDTSAPYAFTWNSANVPNGTATLVAYAYDAAGNSTASAAMSVNVSNSSATTTTTPLTVAIVNPTEGKVNGNVSVSTSVSEATSASGVTQWLYIDGVLKASGYGGKLTYKWNSAKATAGSHTIQAVAQDDRGNKANASVQVTK